MRTLTLAAVVAAAAISIGMGASFALADEPSCPNHCPLAKEANACRGNGDESAQSSKVVQLDVRTEVLTALDRV